MRIQHLTLTAYGRCRDVGIDIGAGVTVVLGVNEAGKSTSLDALSDFLWGIPARTSRASDFTRPQLRIDAVLGVDGADQPVVRKASGLFADDLVTEFSPVWNPAGQLDAQWWRTRLGINHADLRRGGDEVFAGSGDIADIIFAAREGRSAREVLKAISDQADKLFKPDRRSKRVQLRLAMEAYQRAVDERDQRLTRASEVVAQRDLVAELQSRLAQLRNEVTVTSQALKRQEENARVISHVLRLRRVIAELEAIDQEGDRLTPDALEQYQRASAECRSAVERIAKLDSEIESETQAIADLSVNDLLLDDRETFNRLQPNVTARIEDLDRAGAEFGVGVVEAEARLRQLLAGIGVDVAENLPAAVAGARIRDDHAAALNDLAGRIAVLEQQRQQARDERDGALNQLLAKGFAVEIGTAAPPDEDAIGRLRAAVIRARNDEATAQTLLAEATTAVDDLQPGAADRHAGAVLTHVVVCDARSARDAQWGAIRRSWVSGELPETADRVDIAAEFDTALAAADRVGDDEAAERSRVAADDARTAMRITGFETAQRKQHDAAAHLESEAAHRRQAEAEWAAAWADLGISKGPDIDDSSVLLGLLTTAHVGDARMHAVGEQLAETDGLWRAAAELAGLAVGTTCAVWRKHAQVLDEIAAVDAELVRNREREAQALGKWNEFVAEAEVLLLAHAMIEPGQPMEPAVIEQGFARLGRQLEAATEAAGRRTTHRERVATKRAELHETRQSRQDAADALQRLIDSHDVAGDVDLEVLAERAERAAEPRREQREAVQAIKNGLGPGSDLQDVIDRLLGHDEVTVEQALADAQERDREARQAADVVSTEHGLARQRLTALEQAAGAAEAEAAVVTQQGEVARLAETWAMLSLQRKLLEKVLEDLESGDTLPLLDYAGCLLDQLTEGRWVALRAADDGGARKLRVIRADNEPFGPGELSEGTADQVFFALRLAAVAELHNERTQAGEAALPLVLDDVLMAFDEVRVRNALTILTTLAPGLQIIVFTHHQHVAEVAGEVGGITVSSLPPAASIADPLAGDLLRAQP